MDNEVEEPVRQHRDPHHQGNGVAARLPKHPPVYRVDGHRPERGREQAVREGHIGQFEVGCLRVVFDDVEPLDTQ
jgi:hypothetical protein